MFVCISAVSRLSDLWDISQDAACSVHVSCNEHDAESRMSVFAEHACARRLILLLSEADMFVPDTLQIKNMPTTHSFITTSTFNFTELVPKTQSRFQ